jgi:hypothetical protein
LKRRDKPRRFHGRKLNSEGGTPPPGTYSWAVAVLQPVQTQMPLDVQLQLLHVMAAWAAKAANANPKPKTTVAIFFFIITGSFFIVDC